MKSRSYPGCYVLVLILLLFNNLFTQSANNAMDENDVDSVVARLESEDWRIRAATIRAMNILDPPHPFFDPDKALLLKDRNIRSTLTALLRRENQLLQRYGFIPETVDGEFIGEAYGSYYYDLTCTVASLRDSSNIGLLLELIDISTARLVAQDLARLGDPVVQPLMQAINDEKKTSAAMFYLQVLLETDNKENVVSKASREAIKQDLIDIIEENNVRGDFGAVKALGYFHGDPMVIDYLRKIARNHPRSITVTTKRGKTVKCYLVREEARRQLKKIKRN